MSKLVNSSDNNNSTRSFSRFSPFVVVLFSFSFVLNNSTSNSSNNKKYLPPEQYYSLRTDCVRLLNSLLSYSYFLL